MTNKPVCDWGKKDKIVIHNTTVLISLPKRNKTFTVFIESRSSQLKTQLMQFRQRSEYAKFRITGIQLVRIRMHPGNPWLNWWLGYEAVDKSHFEKMAADVSVVQIA